MKIAVCACNASFTIDEIPLMNRHITEQSSTAHYWMWVKDIIITQELKHGRAANAVREG